MITNDGILYIEPSARVSAKPLVDSLTRKMTAAMRKATKVKAWRGFHTCACGVDGDNCDYALPNGEMTNVLAIHYLAYHRDEVPALQLEKIRKLDCGVADPTEKDLRPPGKQLKEEQRPVYRG